MEKLESLKERLKKLEEEVERIKRDKFTFTFYPPIITNSPAITTTAPLSCSCFSHKPQELTGGYYCSIHGHQL